MNTNSVVIHSAALSNVSNSQTIREGSSVYVKVLNQVGQNSYTASFAGARFIVKSNNPLQINSSFVATVKLQNGQVLLVPKSDNIEIVKSFGDNFVNDKIIQDSAMNSYLTQLGLVPDGLSFLMLQTVKNLGMKFNLQVMNKVRNIAMKFPGREKEVTEIALSLEQKGIAITESAIANILFAGGNSDFQDKNNSSQSQNKQQSNILSNNIVETFKSFFQKILNGENISIKSNELTIFNHKGFDFEKGFENGSWIKIPFEFSYKYEDSLKNGIGFANLFLSDKKLSKVVVKYDFDFYQGMFVLGFNQNRCKKIKFAFNCNNQTDLTNKKLDINLIKEKIENNYKDIIVECVDFNSISEFDVDNESISIVRGLA